MNPLVLSAGQLKQELTKVYNEVNLQLFQIGVKRLRVDFVGDRILFMTYHRRVPAIRSVDEKNRELTRMMDILLIDEFKALLKGRLETKYEIKVVSILKDYDPETELSATVVVLEQNVEMYLQKQSWLVEWSQEWVQDGRQYANEQGFGVIPYPVCLVLAAIFIS